MPICHPALCGAGGGWREAGGTDQNHDGGVVMWGCGVSVIRAVCAQREKNDNLPSEK